VNSADRHSEEIYNEPKNAFVADFIGESNIKTVL
jgi:ABC-type Fe3+/spermidine/putrescine transport system ATPase subunit